MMKELLTFYFSQVHIGEYGVHWNFFFTLAGVAILTSVINVPPRYCGLLGFFVLLGKHYCIFLILLYYSRCSFLLDAEWKYFVTVGYQFCLLHGLNDYLLSEKRGTDVISQNKEGIFSMFGKPVKSVIYFTMSSLFMFLGWPSF